MALQISIPASAQTGNHFDPLGIDLPQAYIKITAIVWEHKDNIIEVSDDKSSGALKVTAALWPSKDARLEPSGVLGSQLYYIKNPNLAGDLISQGYAAIKSAGEFCGLDVSNATDV